MVGQGSDPRVGGGVRLRSSFEESGAWLVVDTNATTLASPYWIVGQGSKPRAGGGIRSRSCFEESEVCVLCTAGREADGEVEGATTLLVSRYWVIGQESEPKVGGAKGGELDSGGSGSGM